MRTTRGPTVRLAEDSTQPMTPVQEGKLMADTQDGLNTQRQPRDPELALLQVLLHLEFQKEVKDLTRVLAERAAWHLDALEVVEGKIARREQRGEIAPPGGPH